MVPIFILTAPPVVSSTTEPGQRAGFFIRAIPPAPRPDESEDRTRGSPAARLPRLMGKLDTLLNAL